MARSRKNKTTLKEVAENKASVVKESVQDKVTENVFDQATIKIRNNLYRYNATTVEKTNYELTKAVYFAQEYDCSDDVRVNFQLASAFGKPIVNATTSFIIGNIPKVKLSPTGVEKDLVDRFNANDETLSEDERLEAESIIERFENANVKVHDWMNENYYLFFRLISHAMRDGDSYILIEDINNIKTLDPEKVKIMLGNNGELIGYKVTSEVYVEDEASKKVKTIEYVTEYTKVAPFKKITKYDDTNTAGTVIYQETDSSLVNEEDVDDFRPLPIIQWINEKEDGKFYGNSEYRNVLYAMIKYSLVFEKAIINNNTASTPLPFLSGVGNVQEFLRQNGTEKTLSDGSVAYELNVDGKKVLIGANGEFKAGFADIADTTSGAERLLVLLFYLICQGSEVPEFIMGGAVSSSHASVDAQLPVIVRKAFRKQIEFKPYLNETMESIVNAMQVDPEIPLNYDLTTSWGNILDDEGKVTVEILDKLKEVGLISEVSYANILMSKLGDLIESPAEEIEKAKQERDEMALNQDIFSRNIRDAANDEENPDDNNEEDQ
jgi:hypothetical protein